MPGVGTVHGRGYKWVRDWLIPALKILPAEAPEDRRLLAAGWDLLSGVHFLNGGDNVSLRAEEESMRLAPDDIDFLGEYVGDCSHRGAFDRARKALDEYEQRFGPSPTLLKLRQDLEAACVNPCVLRDLAHWETQVGDALARFDPDAALSVLGRRRSAAALQWKACAHGAREDYPRFHAAWNRLLAGSTAVSLEYQFWFYLPDQAWNEPDFWKSLIEHTARFTKSCLLTQCYVDGLPARPGENTFVWRFALSCEFQLARSAKDLDHMRSLHDEYPDWPEVARHLRWFEEAATPPGRPASGG